MIDPRHTNDIHELIVASDVLTVTVRPADADLGCAVIIIGFSASGGAYDVNHSLLMGAGNWNRWKRAVDAELRPVLARLQGINEDDHNSV